MANVSFTGSTFLKFSTQTTHSTCIILFGRTLISRFQGKSQMVIFGELAFGYFCEHQSIVLKKKKRQLVYLPIAPNVRKTPLNAHENAQEISRLQTGIHNVVSAVTHFAKNIVFHVPISSVRFARYCGKMSRRHFFLYWPVDYWEVLLNPLSSSIKMHILPSCLHTFLMILV